MKKGLLIVALLFGLSVIAQGQSFSSGSSGADGALDLATMSCTTCEIQLPESGVLNYTTVNVPAGKTLKFKKNLKNTPVILLAQGNVNILGTIDISAVGSNCGSFPVTGPGPGGFYGGAPGQPGFGPGGGTSSTPNGQWVGPLSLVPLVGGSGGQGRCPFTCFDGGGGGGAIGVASSTSISITGAIAANGAVNQNCSYTGYSGSGGAIRIVSNTVNVTGCLTAAIVRLEAPQGSVQYNSSCTPPVIATINPVIVPSNSPQLSIVSIGGYQVPAYSGQRFDAIDLLLPNQLPEPINIAVAATNIPIGTLVKITFRGSSSATFTPGTLQGTLASSAATLTVSNLTRSAVTYLFVYATFDPPLTSRNLNLKGKDQVAKVRLEAAPGAKPKYVFLRNDGSEIDAKKLSQKFLQEFGTN